MKRRMLAGVRRPWLVTACIAVMAVSSVAIALDFRAEEPVGKWIVRGCGFVNVLAPGLCVIEALFGQPGAEVEGS